MISANLVNLADIGPLGIVGLSVAVVGGVCPPPFPLNGLLVSFLPIEHVQSAVSHLWVKSLWLAVQVRGSVQKREMEKESESLLIMYCGIQFTHLPLFLILFSSAC